MSNIYYRFFKLIKKKILFNMVLFVNFKSKGLKLQSIMSKILNE